MKSDDDRVYYGWDDIVTFQEAIVFYADAFARGHHHHEIRKMLNGYFPNISPIEVSNIRIKAIEWMRDMATNLEKKVYLAKSILRLERVCANPHEKTRHVLTADNQLTHLLGLADAQEEAGPEEMAVWIRNFNKAAKTASDGSGYIAAEQAEEAEQTQQTTKNPESSEPSESKPEPEPTSQTKPIDELNLSEEEAKINKSLRDARALRLKRDIDSIDDEIRASNEKHQTHEETKTSKELQDEIDLSVYDD